VNLILIVGFIGHAYFFNWKRTLLSSFAPCAGFVTLRRTFVRCGHGVPWLRNDLGQRARITVPEVEAEQQVAASVWRREAPGAVFAPPARTGKFRCPEGLTGRHEPSVGQVGECPNPTTADSPQPVLSSSGVAGTIAGEPESTKDGAAV
jgi:hypothetical protein